MSDVIVIYHSGCWDGFTAAWVARKKYPEAEFVPAQYGDDPPDCKGKNVYILDFSYPLDVMQSISKESAYLCVCDHHKTAEPVLREFRGVYSVCVKFDNDKSGARLTWEYFFGENNCHTLQKIPIIVAMVEDRDLWSWKLPYSREVNACIRSFPFDFNVVDELAEALENDCPDVCKLRESI